MGLPGMTSFMLAATKPAFATDFGEYPLGAQLKDFGWTEQGVGGVTSDGSYTITAYADSISGRGVLVTQGAVGQYRAITWDQVGVVSDCEILALIRLDTLPNAVGGGGIALMNPNGDGIAAGFDSDGTPDSVNAYEVTAGAFDHSIVTQDVTLNTTGKFWIRLRLSTTTVSVKTWPDGSPEPAFASAIEATLVAKKRVGIQTVEKKNFRVYWFAVGRDGGTAPFPNG